jgi:hypothetical protein
MSSLPHLSQPKASRILFSLNLTKSGASTIDEQGAQVAISTFADTDQSGAPTTRSLLRYKPEPGSKLSTILKAFCVTYRCNESRCRHRSDTLNLADMLAILAVAIELSDPAVVIRYTANPPYSILR